MSKFTEGKVVAKRCWAERLYSLQVEAEVAPFQAGQFTKLALNIDGEVVAHPYSFVNAPGEKPLEFYFIEVPGGLLTLRLAALEALPRFCGFQDREERSDAGAGREQP